MKYYSEKLKKLFDDETALTAAEEKAEADRLAAEEKAKKLKETREARAKEVEDAFKVANEKREAATKLLAAFTKDYGSFHYTFHTFDPFDWDPFGIFEDFLR